VPGSPGASQLRSGALTSGLFMPARIWSGSTHLGAAAGGPSALTLMVYADQQRCWSSSMEAAVTCSLISVSESSRRRPPHSNMNACSSAEPHNAGRHPWLESGTTGSFSGSDANLTASRWIALLLARDGKEEGDATGDRRNRRPGHPAGVLRQVSRPAAAVATAAARAPVAAGALVCDVDVTGRCEPDANLTTSRRSVVQP
jgi:hypothetical protein